MAIDDPEVDDYFELWKGPCLQQQQQPPRLPRIQEHPRILSSSALKLHAAQRLTCSPPLPAVPRLVSLVSLYPRPRGRRRGGGGGSEQRATGPRAAGSGRVDDLEDGGSGGGEESSGSAWEVFGRRLLREHLLIGALEASPLDPFTAAQRGLVLLLALCLSVLVSPRAAHVATSLRLKSPPSPCLAGTPRCHAVRPCPPPRRSQLPASPCA